VTPIAQTDPDFEFKGMPEIEEPETVQALAQVPALGPLEQLVGGQDVTTWEGHGFNTIWRPHPPPNGGQDRFLELNLTTEKLVFSKIHGKIPNRGLLMPDINMFGLTYMQQIAETSNGPGCTSSPGSGPTSRTRLTHD
jgi:hypothetical protein